MKKRYRLFALALVLCCMLGGRAQAMENDMIKVGLKYGSNALFSANLYNYEDFGHGYAMGYYSDSRIFVPIGAETGEQGVSMTVDGNVYISSQTYYQSRPASYSDMIGGWHLQLDARYDSFAAASSVASMYPDAFVAYLDDRYAVRVGQYASSQEAEMARAAWSGYDTVSVAAPSGTCVTVTVTGTNRILLEFDCGGRRHLAMHPLSTHGEEPVTWFKGYRYNGDFEYQRTPGGNINVINVVDLESYVKGVIGWELGGDKPLESLKAQAVCARTYAAFQTRHKNSGFDVCNTTDCQVYQGTAASNATTDAAVDQTRGEYLFYNGKPVLEAVYYSSNGGATEDCKNVWGSEVGYLKGKEDPFEASVASRIYGYRWTATYSGAELGAKLQAKGYNIGTVTNVYVSEFTPTGNVCALTFEGTAGTKTVYRESCRTVLGLKSMRFTVIGGSGGSTIAINNGSSTLPSLSGAYAISGSGSVMQLDGANPYVITSRGVSPLTQSGGASGTSGQFTFSGSGSGHNVGLSQWGSVAMAQQGYSYRDILQFYYTGVTIR